MEKNESVISNGASMYTGKFNIRIKVQKRKMKIISRALLIAEYVFYRQQKYLKICAFSR